MRFSSVLISTLAAVATASPNALARREDEAVTEAIKFAVQADDCEIFQCAGVIASAACIGLAIAAGGPAAPAGVVACVAGGVGSVRWHFF